MKSWLFSATIVLLAGLSGTAWPIGNLGVGNPIGPGTVPPSSMQSGLYSSPNPIDTSGNLAITGNVRGGKYFRGTVPYRSTTDFGAPIGSSALDSFLRDSASPEDFGRYAGGYRPYYAPAGAVTGGYRPFYSPTGMVATTQPGRSGVFLPATTKIRGDVGSGRGVLFPAGFDVGAGPEEQDLPGGDASQIGLRLWGPQSQISTLGEPRPMSRTPQEIARLISDELGGELSRRGLQNLRTDGLETEQFQAEMKRISDEAAEPKQTLTAQGESLPTEIGPGEGVERLFDSPAAESDARAQDITPVLPATGGLDAYESSGVGPGTIKGTWQSVEEMKQQIHSLTAAQVQSGASEAQQEDFEQSLGGRLPTFGKTKDFDGREKGPADQNYQAESLRAALEALREKSLTDESRSWVPAGQDASLKQTTSLDKLDRFARSAEDVFGSSGQSQRLAARLGAAEDAYSAKSLRSTGSGVAGFQSAVDVSSDSDLASRARVILGKYKSVAAFWEAKFDEYATAGETYLKQGRYYRAVDAFALASVYKSGVPRAHAGRSLALFGAGEYMSSALFLSRALEIRPEYAGSKIYFAAMLRDKDRLNKRIADAEECLELCREAGSGLSGEADLAFLLGYIYYQMDRLDRAKEAIDAAYEKLPESSAVIAVRKAINRALAGSQPVIK